MIIKCAPKRISGRGSFIDLVEYLETDDDGNRREDLVASWSGGVASHDTAALEMEAVARRYRADAKDPIYHVIISTRPGEVLTAEAAEAAVDAVRTSLDAERHQYVAAMHYDDDTQRYHIHIAMSKVSLDGTLLDRWHDYAKLARAAEWCERNFGLQVDRRVAWRSRLGERDLHAVPDIFVEVPSHERGTRGLYGEGPGASTSRRDAVRRAHHSWFREMAEHAMPAVQAAIGRDGAGWDDVHAALRSYGVRLEASGSGARVVGPEPGQHAKASQLGLKVRELEERFGSLAESLTDDEAWRVRMADVRGILDEARSWEEAHERLADLKFAVERIGRGARLLDLDGGRHAALHQAEVSFCAVERRLGDMPPAPAAVERRAREVERRENGVHERAAMLREQPDIVLDRLAETMSVWGPKDVERIVRSSLGARLGHDEVVEETVRSVLGASIAITEDAYTLDSVVGEEHAMVQSVRALAARSRTVTLRAPDASLDEQQRDAYLHLAGSEDIAVVTGIAGAGKSRLQRDLAAAYTEAGYRVIGSAVAGDAARTLAEEAEMPAKTVAKLLADLGKQRDRLDERTVLMIDEASTLGTAQAREMFAAAEAAGARVLLLGDPAQHESVGRGAVLRAVVEDVGALDMTTTRRAQSETMREVAKDLRAGVVSRALDTMRNNGAVREFDTTEAARDSLAQAWAVSHTSGRKALLIATKNEDVRVLNELARASLSEQLGEARNYRTIFGEREFAVGDTVIARQRAHGGVNGDLYTVEAHEGCGRIGLVRLRDAERVSWDVNQHGSLDHGYAVTSYRSQGRTVDDVFALVAAGEMRRGVYVDVTRARESVVLAYGRDEVEDFGSLLARTQQDGKKALVRDVLLDAGAREEPRRPARRIVLEQSVARDENLGLSL